MAFLAAPGKRIQIEMHAERATTLRARCGSAKLPNRLNIGTQTTQRQWELQQGIQMIEAEITEDNTFCIWEFEPAPGVELAVCDRIRTGFLCGRSGLPELYEPRAWYQDAALYGAEQLTSGENRPWGGVNAWIAAPEDEDPWTELRWGVPVKAREVRLYLDPDLTMELASSCARHWEKSHLFAARQGMPVSLAKELALTAELETGESVQLAELHDQHQRLVTVPLPQEARIRALRVEIRETWGGRPPVIYGIRVY